MFNCLKPIQGCLVKTSINYLNRYGILLQINDRNICKVRWFDNDSTQGYTEIPLESLSSGFSIGMEVKDETPDIGYQKLGRGRILYERNLAGFHQYLVDFEKDNLRVWMPYQHLVPVKNAEARFRNNDISFITPEPERLRLRILANAIQLWNENTGALSYLNIDPLPHQINLVHHILTSNELNWLIADDVGLGKTIETGMLLHALRQRGQARRVLLITPAGLTKQWQEEMYHKFKIEDFEIYGEDFSINEIRQWKLHDYVIGSIDKLKHENHINNILQAESWDLIIFDEGHRLSRRQYGNKFDASDRFNLAKRLRERTKAIILLSATPHQGDQDKFIALLELLRPDRRKELLLLDRNPEIIRDMIYRNHKADVTDKDGNFIFKGKITKAFSIPISEQFKEFEKYLSDYLQIGYNLSHTQSSFARAIGFVMTTYRKLAASSVMAIHVSLCKRIKRLEDKYIEVKETLDFDERYLGESIENELEKIIGEKNTIEFFEGELEFLRKLVSLSSKLIDSDLKIKLFIKDIIYKIISKNSKEKVLIFTEYRTTQEYIKSKLESNFGFGKVNIINGSMSHAERQQAINHFEEEGQFLVSTEAGGEGINLQRNCHIMVNYDLPWNPMRLVQRIGRLYRYGQHENVLIFNLHQPDSVDERVVFMMYQRIEQIVSDLANIQKHEFNDGLKDEILGELSQYIDVEDVLASLKTVGIQRTEERIEKALTDARQAVDIQRELLSYASSGDTENISSEIQVEKKHIDSFLIGMLNLLKIEYTAHAETKYFKLKFSSELQQKFKALLGKATILEVTTDREVAVHRKNTHILDLSSPIMKYLLEQATDYDRGGLSCRIQYSMYRNFNFLTANIIKWQDLQGNVIRKQFCIYTWSPKQESVNLPKILDIFLEPSEEMISKIEVTKEKRIELLKISNVYIQKFMANKSSRYLMPNDMYCVAIALNLTRITDKEFN